MCKLCIIYQPGSPPNHGRHVLATYFETGIGQYCRCTNRCGQTGQHRIRYVGFPSREFVIVVLMKYFPSLMLNYINFNHRSSAAAALMHCALQQNIYYKIKLRSPT